MNSHSRKITDHVYWCGVLDAALRTFDVIMNTEWGTTYNAYFIDADKPALIDTSKSYLSELYLSRVRELVDLDKVQYIVCNHFEPDHSGTLEQLLKLAPNAVPVMSKVGERFFRGLVDYDGETLIIEEDGQKLDLGNLELEFYKTPFLHWPDTMCTWLPADKALFTCDIFGCHYADDRLLSDRVGDFHQAYKYYFDVILRPFKKHLRQAMELVGHLPLEHIMVGHGPLIHGKQEVEHYWGLYEEWSQPLKPEGDKPLCFVFSASSYGMTHRLGKAAAAGAREAGMQTHFFDVNDLEPGRLIDEAEMADLILVGSDTIAGDALAPVWNALALFALVPQKRSKTAGAFGSYGWSGEAAPAIQQRLEQFKFKTPEEPLRVVLRPTEDDLAAAHAWGVRLAENALG
ncbi:MAG: MBL fold metallo-hydrolase [Candidatus Coatesbacteria bacterium]|nr:MBL fold metallo-hydrolase [Candidatus Coatesbacteria bacterium]